MQEFEVIQQFFTRPSQNDGEQIALGIGDDAALLRVSPGHQLAVSTDMSVATVHFFADAAPADIGWKCMAVNLSDMAAMGAQPRWATLAIAMPAIEEAWCQGFAEGLFACAQAAGVELIGGDTTRGPLNISVTILGEVPTGQALRRDGAKAGDDIWVSGPLGRAALWLQQQWGHLQLDQPALTEYALAMHRPQARWALGLALRGLAHSALDVSDGLLADLTHVLNASKVGATLDWLLIPKPETHQTPIDDRMLKTAVLAGGDDYELLWTAPTSARQRLQQIANTLDLPLTRIGHITAAPGLQVLVHGQPMVLDHTGYQHFA